MSSDLSRQLIEQTPFGTSIIAEDIVDTLSFFDDWEERYRYIIDLGKQLPEFPLSMQTEDRIVHGCQSQVWLEVDSQLGDGKVRMAADSDAIIVKGLVAMILAALNNKTPAAIADYDMEDYFVRVDLVKHLSPTRGNGVRAMVERIKADAAKLA